MAEWVLTVVGAATIGVANLWALLRATKQYKHPGEKSMVLRERMRWGAATGAISGGASAIGLLCMLVAVLVAMPTDQLDARPADTWGIATVLVLGAVGASVFGWTLIAVIWGAQAGAWSKRR